MIRMLLVGYVFALRSERRLCSEVQVNLAYRWFCRLSVEDKIPDHSVFSRARHERFRESDALRRVFEGAVAMCIAAGLVGGEAFSVDASLIKAATWADIDIALLVEDKIGATEGPIGARRLIPHRNVRRDLTIDEPLEQTDRAISRVARESSGLQTKAARGTLYHGPGDRDLHDAIGTRTLGIDDDSSLVVDEVICIVGEEWVHAWPGNPGCLRISQRDFFGRLGATTAARTTIVSVSVLLIAVGGIENSKILADCMGCLFRLRPGDRLVARNSLLLV